MRSGRKISIATILGVACLAVCGCGKQGGSITGTAELDGSPLPAGQVVFESGTSTCTGLIVNGKFEVLHKGSKIVPLEKYQVTVWPPMEVPVTNPETMELETVDPVDQSLYPEKYRSKTTSGLTFEPKAGKNHYLIELSR